MKKILMTMLLVLSFDTFSFADTLNLVTFEYYPTMYREREEIKGCAVYIVREALQRMGYDMVINMYPFKRGLLMVENGTADGMFTVYKTPEREKFACYPELPVMYRTISFYVLKNSDITFDGDLEKMLTYSLSTVLGYSFGKTLDRFIRGGKFKSVYPANTSEVALKILLNKRADIMPHTELDMMHLLKKEGAENRTKKLSPTIEKVPTYLIFSKRRKKAAQLADRFVEIINEMKEDGTYEKTLLLPYINDSDG